MQKKNYPDTLMRNRFVTAAAAIVLFAAMAVSVFVNIYTDNTNELKESMRGLFCAHFVDVGQGNACLLSDPDGKYMLIDAGDSENSVYLIKYLKNLGVEKIEYLVITHPHEDHYGGARDVIRNFDVEKLLLYKEFKDTYPYDTLAYVLRERNENSATVLAGCGDNYTFGKAEFEIISPENPDLTNYNDSSLALRVKYGDTAFLFTGDAGKNMESAMIKSGYELKSDVFCAGHHGSSSSNSLKFLKAVNPEFIVVSCAKDNEYGHPHRESVKNFAKIGASVLETSKNGDIIFSSDGEKVELLGVRKDPPAQ